MTPDRQRTQRTHRQERDPATEEITEIAPGVLRSQLPVKLPGLGHVNCYLLEDERGVAVVDPGLPGPESFKALQKRLRSAGYDLKNVHTAIITHSHLDHFGGASRLRKLTDAEIVAHKNFRPVWDTAEVKEPAELPDAPRDASGGERQDEGEAEGACEPDGSEEDYWPPWNPLRTTPWGSQRQPLPSDMAALWKAVEADDPAWFRTPEVNRSVADAEVIRLAGREWQCVHTPGHTEDHICLYDPEYGLMISGDHVLPTITPHIGGISSQPDPLANFFNSLRRMHAFGGVKVVLPAHGHPFTNLYTRSEEIIGHHEHRLEIIRGAAVELREGTVGDYMKRLFSQRVWGDLAESETYAHLEHLRLRGEVVAGNQDGLRTYSLM